MVKKKLSGVWITIIVCACVLFGCCIFGGIVVMLSGNKTKDTTATTKATTFSSKSGETTTKSAVVAEETTSATESKEEITSATESTEETTGAIESTEETMSDEEYQEFIKTAVFTFDDINYTGPDSVGGWEIDIDIKNKAAEDIKYVYIEVAGINAVGDVVWSETDFDDSPYVMLKLTGPIAEGEVGGQGKIWQGVFYNSTVTGFGINSLSIEYTSGLLVTLNKEECRMALKTYEDEH